MTAVARSSERLPAVLAERIDAPNQRRVDDAIALLGIAVARIVTTAEVSTFVLHLASQDGSLQDVWCRDETSAAVVGPAIINPNSITAGQFGPTNAALFARAENALTSLLHELTRPEYTGSAHLRIRGANQEISDDLRGESHRHWRY